MKLARGRRLAFCAALFAGVSTAAADSFSVGSFTKSTGAAPVTQNVAHGLGETPKAVIIWSAGKTSSTIGTGARIGFGFSDMTTDRSVSFESDDGQGTSVASRRVATKVLTMVDQSGTLRAEADLQSADSTNFTLNWTTNNGTAYICHFIAIGGTHVQAKVLGWTMQTSTGNDSITGVGFTPELVLSAHAGAGATGAPSATSSNSGFGLSARDARGGQWALATFSTDGAGTSDTSRYQRSDKGLVSVGGSQSKSAEASWVSMDTDGFTINYTTAASQAGQVISLALGGLQADAGSFNKATGAATATQNVTGVAFRPRLVFLAGVQNTSTTSGVQHNRLGLGASYVTTEGGVIMQDTDGLDTTSVDGDDSTTKAYMKVNNDTQTTDAEADLTSLDTAGFTLDWTTNDAVATDVLYLALSTPRRIVVVGRPSPRGRARGGARHATPLRARD